MRREIDTAIHEKRVSHLPKVDGLRLRGELPKLTPNGRFVCAGQPCSWDA